ncbi:MAG: ADP-ribose pyrophosphatase [Phycisphaerales bacterium]|jgi:ADP-ribose pyrophosphatase
MKTIVIGIGLDNKFLSADVAHLEHKKSIGAREIERLMGRGKSYGEGPLPTFLKRAALAADRGEDISCITVTWTGSTTGDSLSASPSASELKALDVVEVLKPYLSTAEIVGPDEERSLWSQLKGAITTAAGIDPAKLNLDNDTRFLVVGCHTEDRVLTLATFLRNVLGAKRVAVSSHLTGSSSIEAHFAALRHNLPACEIEVLLDLQETAEYAGLDPTDFEQIASSPCEIGPPESVSQISDDRLQIIERLCMNWSRVELKPLQGGFSGSLLFLADGWKGHAQIEPVVLKIDEFTQMRREINGYHLVKDLLGKNVPAFSHPVSIGDSVGVAMEFAAMEGRPETLQETFENAEDDESFQRFMGRLGRALVLISQKLHRNTSRTALVAPYRVLGLDGEQQLTWLEENASEIAKQACDRGIGPAGAVDHSTVVSMLQLITSNIDAIESEVCLSHGDLNLQNIICDNSDNVWFIDWTHSGETPIEVDFAKLENDLKFVMSKQFGLDDLERLRRFEEFLLGSRVVPEPELLPPDLRFVKWDLRFRKILDGVRRIREICFEIKEHDDWLVYRVALLKFAAHTLSFDAARDRGECELPQLMHALYSVESLAFNLVADDFHLQIRGERPPEYPARCRVSIDYAPWSVPCPEYTPPYFVHESVLSPSATTGDSAWADGEDHDHTTVVATGRRAKRDDAGRLLNPRGRTGIAGRGLLGRWGPNQSAAGVVLRKHDSDDAIDVLVGLKPDGSMLWVPKGFMHPTETGEQALKRVLHAETGWEIECDAIPTVSQGYFYDPRQTDHAWVKIQAFGISVAFEQSPRQFTPGGEFEEIQWARADEKTLSRMAAAEARCVKAAISAMETTTPVTSNQPAVT